MNQYVSSQPPPNPAYGFHGTRFSRRPHSAPGLLCLACHEDGGLLALGLHPGSSRVTSQRVMAMSSMRSPWRPSPCERRYRLHGWTLPHRLLWRLRRFRFMAITIRASVELLTLTSLRKPPTFTRLDSTAHLR